MTTHILRMKLKTTGEDDSAIIIIYLVVLLLLTLYKNNTRSSSSPKLPERGEEYIQSVSMTERAAFHLSRHRYRIVNGI